ncbi:MAG: response regulator [Verrucomicrobiota bacterium]
MSSSSDVSGHSRASGRVLVVDDEPHVLAVALAMLESQGFHAVGCASGEEALNLLGQPGPDSERFRVLVLDITLPGGMSGFDVLEVVQVSDPDLRVIACSGFFQDDARDLCQALGFVDILPKPYPLENLCASVRRCLVRDRSTSPVVAS